MLASVVVAVSYALNQQNVSRVNLFLARSFLVFQTVPSVETQEDSISHFWIGYKIGNLKSISKTHIWQFILKSDISGNPCIFELNPTFKVAQTPYFLILES